MIRLARTLLIPLLCVLAGACSDPSHTNDPANADASADFPLVEGWETVGDVLVFDSASLYQHINGAADAYVSYGFEELKVSDLSDGTHTVTVNLYEMSSPLSAFGIYRTEAPVSEAALDIGAEARLAPPYQAFLLKDRYYVKVDALEGDLSTEWTPQLLGSIASQLPGTDALASELLALPTANQAPESLAYSKQSFLGLSELTDCVHATYSADGEDGTFVGFMMLPPDGNEPALWDRLEALEPWNVEQLGGSRVLVRDVPYTGRVAVVRGKDGQLFGAAGAAGAPESQAQLEQLGFLQP